MKNRNKVIGQFSKKFPVERPYDRHIQALFRHGGTFGRPALREASKELPSHLLQFSADKKPVVVWNMTRQCNLKCVHCYAQAKVTPTENELTTAEGKTLIDDLSLFGCSGDAVFRRRAADAD